jgi:hypothetical protein
VAKVGNFIFNNMKKDKVYELRIDEEDELSGIDSISLVDEPAIEVNWVAFNKHKHSSTEECFHIPDGEDSKYLELLYTKGSPEQELLEQGYQLVSMEVGGEKFLSTKPNAPSEWNEDDLLVRYKYILDPRIKQAPIIPTTRDFCSELLNKNFVWRVEDMDDLQNDFGQSAMVWRGGFNCRHRWAKLFYKKDTTIVNKGSITEGRVKTEDYGEILGYPQPDTITNKTRNNPSQSTKKNLGLSKENFEEGVPHYTKDGKLYTGPTHKGPDGRLMTGAVHTEDSEYLYHEDELGYDVGGIGGYVDPGVKKKKKDDVIEKSIAFESYNDYPESAKNNACKVLRWRDEHGDEVQGMTQIGWTRANQLCKGENISEETIARMASFARHRQNAEVSPEFKSTPWKDKGYVAWLGWGGTTGVEWAQRKLESIRNDMSKQKFQTDDEKRMVVGPAMIPDLKIFRKDMLGNPYYVFFSAETIKMIAEKYMRNKYIDNNDTNHDGKAAEDVYVVESWIVEDPQYDKSKNYGFSVPAGTWMVSMKVRNDEVWKKVKNGELRGFSVSGFFEEIADFAREQMFLQQVAEILKNVK